MRWAAIRLSLIHTHMRIWIINPFDELPGDTDIRHRYWALADTLSDLGHSVTWWSSDFSHRSKSYRNNSDTGHRNLDSGQITRFQVKLIHTSPYISNVSLARLRNHRQFAKRFLHEAMLIAERDGGPDRMVVSLPPLGTAQACFDIREKFGGEVIVDVMDAWPETFSRLFPRLLRPLAKPLLASLYRSARDAYCQADRISAVSQTYIDLAKGYRDSGFGLRDSDFHLCYHGIDLIDEKESDLQAQFSNRYSQSTKGNEPPALSTPLKIAYIGSLERSYDLETAIRAVYDLNEDNIPAELHIAGAGSQESRLKSLANELRGSSQLNEKCFYFHRLLDQQELRVLLECSQLGLIPMNQDSFIGIPYKLADYSATGLPVISSLDGECRQFLDTKKAGMFYTPASKDSLTQALKAYLHKPELHASHSVNALGLATALFDRRATYPEFASFIINKH